MSSAADNTSLGAPAAESAGAAEPVLVDPLVLAAHAGDSLPGDGRLDVERLAEGHSNLTFVVRRGQADGSVREWILRRPPRGPLLPTAHDVVREARVMDLLARSGSGVPVPAVALVCEDPDVMGAPFYLMERVAGTVVRNSLPGWLDGNDAAPVRHAAGIALVDALAALHAAPVAPFLEAGLGKPDGYLARQLRRWRGQREGSKVRELPDYDVVSEWLEGALPQQSGTAVVHGDYKLDNVLLTPPPTGPRVAAILDWEMATVGDPLADLGYVMSFWLEPGEHEEFLEVAGAVTTVPGWPTRAEMVARYAEQTGRAVDLDALAPYVVLATWKLAVLLEGSYSRHLAGTTDDPFFAMLDRGVPALLARARRLTGV